MTRSLLLSALLGTIAVLGIAVPEAAAMPTDHLGKGRGHKASEPEDCETLVRFHVGDGVRVWACDQMELRAASTTEGFGPPFREEPDDEDEGPGLEQPGPEGQGPGAGGGPETAGGEVAGKGAGPKGAVITWRSGESYAFGVLPRTASSVPLITMLGLWCLGLGLILKYTRISDEESAVSPETPALPPSPIEDSDGSPEVECAEGEPRDIEPSQEVESQEIDSREVESAEIES